MIDESLKYRIALIAILIAIIILAVIFYNTEKENKANCQDNGFTGYVSEPLPEYSGYIKCYNDTYGDYLFERKYYHVKERNKNE